MANAAMLIDAISETDDPVRLTERLHRRAIDQLEPWFHDTVALDNETNALWTQSPPPVVHGSRRPFSHSEALAATRIDPVLNVAYTRYRNLLDAPSKFWDDSLNTARVAAALADGAPDATLTTPTRDDIVSVA